MSEVQASTALVAMVLNAGVSAEELAHAAGLDLRIVESPTLIPYQDGMRLWQAAAQLTGDAAVGLHAGMSCRVDRVPVLGTMFAHSDNLADALERLARHLPQVIRGVQIRFSREDSGEFIYHSPSRARHGVDSMFAAIVQLARDCSGDRVRPSAVSFQSAAPDDPAPYVDFFGTRPRWDQTVCSMRFEATALDTAFRGASPALVTVLESHTASLLDAGHGQQKAIEAVVQRAALRCLGAG
ncbi:MAG TPA: AraC family transcriptional regulator, partial [Polyangiaceae bacterium]|nr:AraC family transcriptional regulator [Polyangiaceae bacterium]